MNVNLGVGLAFEAFVEKASFKRTFLRAVLFMKSNSDSVENVCVNEKQKQ